MKQMVRCRKCGEAFNPNKLVYCGTDFCPSCRPEPQNAVVSAEKETYRACRDAGMDKDRAEKKGYEIAQKVERIRKKERR